MPFPYVTPLKEWIVNILKEREKDPQKLLYKMPYAILTSPALVVNDRIEPDTTKRIEQLKNIIAGKSTGTKRYCGCVISNNINIQTNYQQNDTIVGYDLNGQRIVVENESNRRVSPPIIESVEIDTDGGNNTLKNATITVKCFTLKQLEMFELFYLKPGMNLLLEFGDSSLLRYPKDNGFSKPEDALVVNKTNYDKFINEYVESYSAPTIEAIQKWYLKYEQSKGSYDFVAGKLTDFSYSIDESAIYNISITISQGNQFSFSLPNKVGDAAQPSSGGQNKNTPKLDFFEQAKKQIVYDFNIDEGRFNELLKSLPANGKNEFFNWDKKNEKQSDDFVSFEPYISLRFILKVLMGIPVPNVPEFKFEVPKYKVNGIEEDFIPVRSSELLISSSDVILFPGKNPSLTVSDPKSDTIEISNGNEKSTLKIGGYSFNQNNTTIITKEFEKSGTFITIRPKDTNIFCTANLLNCFLLYNEVLQIWKKTYTRLDFIEQIIKLINENGYGLWNLRLSAEIEGKNRTIVDYKIENEVDKSKSITPYRFKPGTINSIVKDFTFEMRLDELVAARSVFNTYSFISEAIVKKDEDKNKNNKKFFSDYVDDKVYKSVAMSQYTSSDGYYSINKIEEQSIIKNRNLLEKQFNEKITPTNEQPEEEKEESPNTTTKQQRLDQLLQSKIKNFKKNKSDNVTLVYNDKSTIIKKLSDNVKDIQISQRSTLTPIEISLVIDGLSGFSCGEYFNIDGVPETYNQDGVFQITNIKHNLDTDGWSTTLEAMWKIIN